MSTLRLLCLSSGLNDRYRHDVLRAIALPYRSRIQYRYSSDIVEPSIQAALGGNRLRGAAALLAHVDASAAGEVGEPLVVTPARRAVLVSSRQIGDYFILVFELWGYVVTEDANGFQATLPDGRPVWAGASAKGFWCAPYEHSQKWEEEFGLEGFQRVARSLKQRADFATQSFFFAIEKLSERGNCLALEPNANGEIILKAGRHFDLRLFHFDPSGDHKALGAAKESISVTLTKPLLESVTQGVIDVDSPYDLKSFLFRTTTLHLANQAGAIVITTIDKQTQQATRIQPELHLPVDVRMPVGRMIVVSAMLAVLLFAQQYIAATAKGPISVATVLVLFGLAVITAGFAIFGLKRPV